MLFIYPWVDTSAGLLLVSRALSSQSVFRPCQELLDLFLLDISIIEVYG